MQIGSDAGPGSHNNGDSAIRLVGYRTSAGEWCRTMSMNYQHNFVASPALGARLPT